MNRAKTGLASFACVAVLTVAPSLLAIWQSQLQREWQIVWTCIVVLAAVVVFFLFYVALDRLSKGVRIVTLLKNFDDQSRDLADWKSEVEHLKEAINPGAAGVIPEESTVSYSNTCSLLSDASAWAIHFSNVRLGVMAIVTPLTLGVIALNSKPTWQFWLPITVLWLSAMGCFLFCTKQQIARLHDRRKNLNKLLNKTGSKGSGKRWLEDGPTWVVGFLTLFLIVWAASSFTKGPTPKQQKVEWTIEGDITPPAGGLTGEIQAKGKATVEAD